MSSTVPVAETHSGVLRSSTVTVASGRAARLRALRLDDDVARKNRPSSNMYESGTTWIEPSGLYVASMANGCRRRNSRIPYVSSCAVDR
jgi:hypothetical protein